MRGRDPHGVPSTLGAQPVGAPGLVSHSVGARKRPPDSSGPGTAAGTALDLEAKKGIFPFPATLK